VITGRLEWVCPSKSEEQAADSAASLEGGVCLGGALQRERGVDAGEEPTGARGSQGFRGVG
jgi:hypothetical protein